MDPTKKKGRYDRLYMQLTDLLAKSGNRESRMATIVAVLHHHMKDFFWTGFYLLKNSELVVQTYQGPLACQVLEKDKGVCWAGINQQKTIIVTDVHQFPGHIACDPRSQSEIVVPVRNNRGQITGVLDIDSRLTGNFDETDAIGLERIVSLLSE
jgi:L-methionine (R)-S-oxide reductase